MELCQFLRIQFHCNDNIAFIEIYLTSLPFKSDTHAHPFALHRRLHQIVTLFIILHNANVIQFRKNGFIQLDSVRFM